MCFCTTVLPAKHTTYQKKEETFVDFFFFLCNCAESSCLDCTLLSARRGTAALKLDGQGRNYSNRAQSKKKKKKEKKTLPKGLTERL